MITMKSSTNQTGFFKPTGRKAVIALAFASLLGGLSISPAFAERNNDHYRDNRHGDRQHESRRDHNHRREWRHDRHAYRYQPEYRRSYYYYAQPVYVPPPVYYYEPPRPPGINLYFPLDLRR